MLVTIKLKTSASFRSIGKIVVIVTLYFDGQTKTPSHDSVMIWVQKIGYYELNKPKQRADDWILILDESIKIGQDKLLVIFGIREHDIDFTRPLVFGDLTPLVEMVKPNWTSELIKEQLVSLRETLGTITYAVGDYGSCIKKGLRLAQVPQVYDITHQIATILKKMYKNDDRFQAFLQEMAKMRNHHFQTSFAYIIPPRQRQKSRYQNIGVLADWGMKVLSCLPEIEHDDLKEKLSPIAKYEDLIRELEELNRVICAIEKNIKHNGLSKATVKECQKLLTQLQSPEGKKFNEEMNAYFQAHLKLAPEAKKLLATSDIIESAFGKYKNYLSQNPMAGITSLALCIAAFTASLDKKDIEKALESTSAEDIKKWTEENIGTSVMTKRRKLFDNQSKSGKIIKTT
jgi:hypothetical protein